MSQLKGLLSGALALSMLDLLLTTKAQSQVTGLFSIPGLLASWVIDPTVPLVPDLKDGQKFGQPASNGSSSSQSSASGKTSGSTSTNPAPPSPEPGLTPSPSVNDPIPGSVAPTYVVPPIPAPEVAPAP